MDIVINIATLAAITTALTEIVKRTFSLADRFVAGTSLLIGVILSLTFIAVSQQAALIGIVAALMASGLWSQANTWAGK